MLIQLLAALDFIVLISLFGLHLGFIKQLAIFSIIYMLIKSIIFIKDPFSIIDLIIAFYLILMLFGIKIFITYIFAAYLIYKIIVSFIY